MELLQDKTVDAFADKNKRISELELQQLDIWSALRDKAVADGDREKDKLYVATASSSNQPPPGPPGKPAIAKSKPAQKPVMVQNPAIPMPSHQPSGVSVPGPQRAVQPNIGLSIPASLAPPTNNTREDDKPLNKTFREGADPAVRKKHRSKHNKWKQKRENYRDAEEKQEKQAKKADPPAHTPAPAPKSSTPAPEVKKENKKPLEKKRQST